MNKNYVELRVSKRTLMQALSALRFRARMCDGHNAASKRLRTLCESAELELCTASQTAAVHDAATGYPAGARCLDQVCGRVFTPEVCREYGFGEGDQPDTCPTCGARIEPLCPGGNHDA